MHSHIFTGGTASCCSMCIKPINYLQQQLSAQPTNSNMMRFCALGAAHVAAGSFSPVNQQRSLDQSIRQLNETEQTYHHAVPSQNIFASPSSCVWDIIAPAMLCGSPSTVPAQVNSSHQPSLHSTSRRIWSTYNSIVCDNSSSCISSIVHSSSRGGGSRASSSSSRSSFARRRYSTTARIFTTIARSSGGANAGGVSRDSSTSGSGLQPPAVSEISSVLNPYIKHCVKLRERARYRQEQGRLLLVGATLLSELADSSTSLEAVTIFVRSNTRPPAGVVCRHVITVTDAVMRKLTGLEEAAGVTIAAELALPAFVNLLAGSQADPGSEASGKPAGPQGSCPQLQRLLVLEGVQDPGNLGTLLRCAMAFGWDAVWLLPGCADPFNDKALRASRGAALLCPLAAGSFEQLLAVVEAHNMLLLAAEPEHDQPHQQQHNSNSSSSSSSSSMINIASRPVCLVLGTEGVGLSQQVLALATPLSVPMVGQMESLNVGVAGAILMFALSDGGLEQLWSRLRQVRLC